MSDQLVNIDFVIEVDEFVDCPLCSGTMILKLRPGNSYTLIHSKGDKDTAFDWLQENIPINPYRIGQILVKQHKNNISLQM